MAQCYWTQPQALFPGRWFGNIGIILMRFILKPEFLTGIKIKTIYSLLFPLDMCHFAPAVALAIRDSSLLCHLDTAFALAI